MGITATPRSVSEATRFTATTPHASSKGSRFAPPRSSAKLEQAKVKRSPIDAANSDPLKTGGNGGSGGSGGPGKPPAAYHETPEQKVARLRAQHRRAQQAQISRFDRIIAAGRRFFDSAHQVTVMGLIGFTGLAMLATGYTAVDMYRINRARKAEFVAIQRQLEADSLAAARLAYMTGTATAEQTALVDEANERESGQGGGIFSMPKVLSEPRPLTPSPAQEPHEPQNQSVSAAAVWPGSSDTGAGAGAGAGTEQEGQEARQQDEKSGTWAWLGWTAKTTDQTGGQGHPTDAGAAAGTTTKFIREKAHAAFATERENQQRGGPLDRLGLDTETPSGEQPTKRGWW